MPELPEVEAVATYLRAHAVGSVVARIDVAAINVLKTFDPPVTSLAGLTITEVTRHGKFLDLDVDGLHLVIHLARAGWLQWRDNLPPAPPKPGKGPLALRVHLDRSLLAESPEAVPESHSGFDLTEAGTQKRLAVYVVRAPQDVPGIARLGPDPLSPGFDVARFAALLNGNRSQIKGVLRDQSVIAGVGNAYSDEILHVAQMSPFKTAASLTEAETQRLYEALQSTLRDAIARSNGLDVARLKGEKRAGMRVHGRTGEACPVCGDTVREVSFADNSLQYCPTCQTGGKPLADRRLSRLLK
ncbi:MAG: Fpg/Nei family DNA glycosylase [Actinomycetales bacterium]